MAHDAFFLCFLYQFLCENGWISVKLARWHSFQLLSKIVIMLICSERWVGSVAISAANRWIPDRRPSLYRCRLTNIGIPIAKIRRPRQSYPSYLIVEIPISEKTVFILRQGPGSRPRPGCVGSLWPWARHITLHCFSRPRRSREKQKSVRLNLYAVVRAACERLYAPLGVEKDVQMDMCIGKAQYPRKLLAKICRFRQTYPFYFYVIFLARPCKRNI